MAQIIV